MHARVSRSILRAGRERQIGHIQSQGQRFTPDRTAAGDVPGAEPQIEPGKGQIIAPASQFERSRQQEPFAAERSGKLSRERRSSAPPGASPPAPAKVMVSGLA